MKNIEYGIICYFDAVAVYYIKVLYTESKQERSAPQKRRILVAAFQGQCGIPTWEIPCYK
jgi:hypothetical protein